MTKRGSFHILTVAVLKPEFWAPVPCPPICDEERHGVTEVKKLKHDVYPNPTSSIINIKNINVRDKIIIFNNLGLKIMEINTSGSEIDISVEKLPSGIYLIRINDDEYIKFSKI